MTTTLTASLVLTLCLAIPIQQDLSGETKYQVIQSREITISPRQPSVMLTFTLPEGVDTNAPAFLLYKTSGVDLGFNRLYMNPQVPTPENPTCGFPDIRDPNDRYLLTYLDQDFSAASGHVLIRPGLLRPGLNRLLICEDGNDDDEGLFDAFGIGQIILVYTFKAEK